MSYRQLIPEDGTGLSNANTYVSLSYANSYFSRQQNAKWMDLDAQVKEMHLINAAIYMDQRYGLLYKGQLLTQTQRMLFPRTTFTDNYGRLVESGVIPDSLKDAQCEMALLDVDGLARVDPDLGTSNLKRKKDKIDVIEKELEWFAPVKPGQNFIVVAGLLSSLLNSARSNRTVRA